VAAAAAAPVYYGREIGQTFRDMDTPDPAGAPSLDGPWSLGEATFLAIARDLEAVAPTPIVEFGSGASSVRLAQAFPAARVWSVEGGAEFCARTRALAAAHGIDAGRLVVEHRPVGFRRIGAGMYETYARGPFPPVVDAVLIDGPPHWTGRGREACLYDVFANLRVGGRVYLDDYDRAPERLIARHWIDTYPDALRASSLDVGHGVCVVEKVAPGPGTPRLGLGTALDAWLVHVKRLASLVTSAKARARRGTADTGT
jgi:hypothetical protein